MKYAFIVNPASGQGKQESLLADIDRLIKSSPEKDIKVYNTRGERDATVIADRLAAETEGEIVIFACGGDGTVQEVVNGIYGHDNAILGVVPVGSGNDFVRELGKKNNNSRDYTDLERHIGSSIHKIDLIKVSWIESGQEKSRMISNGINIGFDGNTCLRLPRIWQRKKDRPSG